MMQYVKEGTIPSLLRHSFSLDIPEFNCLTFQLGPFLDKAGCRTPLPLVTGRTHLFPILNSNCFQRMESGVNGARCRPCSWVLFMADQRFSIMTTQKMRTFGYHYSKELSRCSPQSCDQLPCCREHFLSVISVSGPRPTTTASKCGSLIRWCRMSCLTNQHTRIITLRDNTEENHGKTRSSKATPQIPHMPYTICSSWGKWLHLPSLNFLTCKMW